MLKHDFRLQQRLLPQLAEILQCNLVMLAATALIVTLQLLQQAHERIASAQAGSHSVQRQSSLLARSAQPLLQLQRLQQSRQLLRIARQRRTLALRLLHVADELVQPRPQLILCQSSVRSLLRSAAALEVFLLAQLRCTLNIRRD